MKIKICGMRDPENIRAVGELAPDFMGFIFYDRSPRFVGDTDLTTYHLPLTTKVGVFVNQPVPSLIRTATRHDISLLQLHGEESPEYCEELRLLDFRIIKAFGVDVHFDFSILGEYEDVCDYFLFDTKTLGYGGSGQRFSWSLLKRYTLDKPIILAGGLDIESVPLVHDLLNELPVHALDFNSKLEIEPGLKDISKCREVIAAVHELSR